MVPNVVIAYSQDIFGRISFRIDWMTFLSPLQDYREDFDAIFLFSPSYLY